MDVVRSMFLLTLFITIIPYSYTVLIVGSALLSLATIFGSLHLLKTGQKGIQSWHPDSSAETAKLYEELMLPLLLFEERYPSFGKVLALVLKRFPIGKFVEEPEFLEALELLKKEAYSGNFGSSLAIESLCRVVGEFVKDSDVEYHCRPDLYVMLDQFLKEIEPTGKA